MNAASACAHLSGSAARAAAVETVASRDERDRDGRRVVGEARDPRVPGEADAARERRGEVVGVALELDARREELLGARGRAPAQLVGSDEAERDHGRARPEAALARDAVDEREAPALDGREPGERPDAEMVEVGGSPSPSDTSSSFQRSSATAAQSNPGPRFAVRRRRANADDAHRDAASIASGSGSTATGSGLRRAAVSGSLSPCPVTTQTTVEPGSRSASPSAARPAAEAGSQKMPSSRASSRHAREDRVVRERHDAPPDALERLGDRRRAWAGSRDADRRGDRRRALGGLAGNEPGHAAGLGEARARTRSVLPPPPYGSASTSGAAPSSSTISNAAVFWPSRRSGLSELTSTCVPRVRELARRRERLVEAAANLEHARAERARLGELPGRDRARGLEHDRRRAPRVRRRRRPTRPCCPVDAQTTARAPLSSAFEIATVIPRSLKLPVGFAPSHLR